MNPISEYVLDTVITAEAFVNASLDEGDRDKFMVFSDGVNVGFLLMANMEEMQRRFDESEIAALLTVFFDRALEDGRVFEDGTEGGR